jgi:hypothetical protein
MTSTAVKWKDDKAVTDVTNQLRMWWTWPVVPGKTKAPGTMTDSMTQLGQLSEVWRTMTCRNIE